MEKHGDRRVKHLSSSAELSQEAVNEELEHHMTLLQDAVDSPQTHTILGNAILTLLELPEHSFSLERVYSLLSQDEVRASVVKKLKEAAADYWSKEWDSLWRKDADPLFSSAQQRVARRIRLADFWSKEWNDIPEDVKTHAANVVRERMK